MTAPGEVTSQALSASLSSSRCQGLSKANISGVTITKATLIAAGTVTPDGAAGPLPAHCLVQGNIDPHTGIDNKPYAIGFELRLPTASNGRFFFQGGGGTDGILAPAYGAITPSNPSSNALTLGYAVASTDGGHLSEADPAVGAVQFGLDPKARTDYGYNALDRTTVVAKQLFSKAYGDGPAKSYFVGCSSGGRQGMVAASRFKHFDGIVAGDPGFDLPKAGVQHPWDTQSLVAIGAPTIADSFSFSDLGAVGGAITASCDALDGVADGMVNNFPACRFDPASLRCPGAKAEGCLSPAQVTALTRIFGGVKDSAGKSLYSDWPWDAGISSFGWRIWKMGPLSPQAPLGVIQTFAGAAVPYIFITPPVATNDTLGFLLGFNFDTDAPKIFARSGAFNQSSMEFMTPPDLTLKKLKNSKGKMIVYHGVSDPVFSINDTTRWYDEFDRANDKKGRDFVRLFAVPGMTHCQGGPATDDFDMLSEIVDWVEHDKAPGRVLAGVRPAPANPEIPADWGARSRPLCVWPKQARYNGSGDVNQASNFSCK